MSQKPRKPEQDSGASTSITFQAAFDTTDSSSSTFLYINTECDQIIISEDKLKLKLIKFKQNRRAKYAWIAPLGVTITIVLTLCTAQFHETFRLTPDTLRGFAIAALFASIIWLIITIGQLVIYLWRYKKLSDIDEFLDEIKQEQTAQRFQKPPSFPAGLK